MNKSSRFGLYAWRIFMAIGVIADALTAVRILQGHLLTPFCQVVFVGFPAGICLISFLDSFTIGRLAAPDHVTTEKVEVTHE